MRGILRAAPASNVWHDLDLDSEMDLDRGLGLRLPERASPNDVRGVSSAQTTRNALQWILVRFSVDALAPLGEVPLRHLDYTLVQLL